MRIASTLRDAKRSLGCNASSSHRPSLTGAARRASGLSCRCSSSGNAASGAAGQQAADPSAVSRRFLLSQAAAATILSSASTAWVAGTAAPRAAWAAEAGPVMPSLEVMKAIDAALAKVVVKGKAPVALRLAFHDAGTFSKAGGDGGMNASIQYELDRPESFGLKRGWRLVLEMEKQLVGTPAEGRVSQADLIALVGAAAVAVCGGPSISVPIGRIDATGPDPENRLPGEKLTAEELKANFASKGLNIREMVALSGAHTIGGKGFGAPDVFDNAYYASLLAKPWLDPANNMASMIGLPSDHVLPDDADCLPIIKEYAADQAAFFTDFTAAYVKMTSLGVGWRA